jgi:hypothetical protein
MVTLSKSFHALQNPFAFIYTNCYLVQGNVSGVRVKQLAGHSSIGQLRINRTNYWSKMRRSGCLAAPAR